VIVQALAISLVIRTLLFQPSTFLGSMIPTLLIGDYVFVSKYAYGYSKYSSLSVRTFFRAASWVRSPSAATCWFKLPRDNETDYIKRVIGLPGDRIQMIDGRLYINNVVVPREPIAKARTEGRDGRESSSDLQGDSSGRRRTHIIEIEETTA